jgi:hypothetical protein
VNEEYRRGSGGSLMKQFRGMTARYMAIMSAPRRSGNLFNKALMCCYIPDRHIRRRHAEWKNVIYWYSVIVRMAKRSDALRCAGVMILIVVL